MLFLLSELWDKEPIGALEVQPIYTEQLVSQIEVIFSNKLADPLGTMI